MISLEEYKKYLLNSYCYPIDSLPDRVKERKYFLERNYPDNFLNKVIEDTYLFVKDIFNCETLKHGYCDFEIDDDTSFGIYLNISGGGYSDNLFEDNEGKIISEYILKTVFGSSFYIEIKCDEIDRDCEEDVLSYDYHYSLYMQGFPNNLDEIKDKYLSDERVLRK